MIRPLLLNSFSNVDAKVRELAKCALPIRSMGGNAIGWNASRGMRNGYGCRLGEELRAEVTRASLHREKFSSGQPHLLHHVMFGRFSIGTFFFIVYSVYPEGMKSVYEQAFSSCFICALSQLPLVMVLSSNNTLKIGVHLHFTRGNQIKCRKEKVEERS